MKKIVKIVSVLGIVGALVVFSTMNAGATVVGSKHDLTQATGSGNTYYTNGTDEVCVFCHTPHGADNQAPLWNRSMPTGPFTMYNSATIDMTIAAAPQGVSLACLSCHDGSIAFDALINGPGSGNYTAGGASQGYTWTGGSVMGAGVAKVGPDLSTEHPVSVTYDTLQDSAFNAAAGGLPLYGASSDQVECGSCHNPHENNPAWGPFLRASNAGSALCTTCHIK